MRRRQHFAEGEKARRDAGSAAFWNDGASRRFSNQRMSSNPNAPIRAAVLSATLSFEPRPADPFELRVPVIRRVMPRITPPLDLDTPIYRYRVDIEGNVSVLRDAVGARSCSGTRGPRRPHLRCSRLDLRRL
jgi:hypothetical protein